MCTEHGHSSLGTENQNRRSRLVVSASKDGLSWVGLSSIFHRQQFSSRVKSRRKSVGNARRRSATVGRL